MIWKSSSKNKAVNTDLITFWYMDTGTQTMHINGIKFAYNSEANELWEILKTQTELWEKFNSEKKEQLT